MNFILGVACGTPILGETPVVGGSAMLPFEGTMVVCCRLSTVTTALSVTIWLQFAISNVSDAQINRWRVTLGQNSGRKELTNASQILTRSYAKEIVSTTSTIEHNART